MRLSWTSCDDDPSDDQQQALASNISSDGDGTLALDIPYMTCKDNLYLHL